MEMSLLMKVSYHYYGDPAIAMIDRPIQKGMRVWLLQSEGAARMRYATQAVGGWGEVESAEGIIIMGRPITGNNSKR